MKNAPLLISLITIVFAGSTVVKAQEKPAHNKITIQVENVPSSPLPDSTELKDYGKDQWQAQKQNALESVNQLTIDSTSLPKPQNTIATEKEKLLKRDVSEIQYNSENPDSAPWKQHDLDDLKDLQTNDLTLPGINKPDNGMSPEIPATPLFAPDKKLPSVSTNAAEVLENNKREKDRLFSSLQDSISALTGTNRIYSEKFKRSVYDSLGASKADSLFNVVSPYLKNPVSKEDLIAKINTPLSEQPPMPEGVGYDEKTGTLTSEDADKLQQLPEQATNKDLTKLKLPDSLLSELPPLSGAVIDSSYLRYIDSVRLASMEAKGLMLDEKQITEEIKQSALKEKPGFLDKLLFEGIVGYMQDTSFTIVQITPALAYQMKSLTIGAGPMLSAEFKEKKIGGQFGLRTFAKYDVYKQFVYWQLEDQMEQSKLDKEDIKKSRHSVLTGAGFIVPITKGLAININLLYRINQEHINPQGSPWVFRIGLSSFKKPNE